MKNSVAEMDVDKEDLRQWFLRINGETIFGPVSTEGLIIWAEQGRILPGHEVSTDRKKWEPAISVALLDMRWFVDEGQGDLRGPLNKLAAEALLKSGKVSEQAIIVSVDDINHADKNTPQPLSDKQQPITVPNEMLHQRIRELELMVSDQRERLSKLANANALELVQHERDVLNSLLKDMEVQRDTILRNVEKDARAQERKCEGLRQQIKKLEQQLEEIDKRDVMPNAQEVARLVLKAKEEAVQTTQKVWEERETALRQELQECDSRRTVAEQAFADAGMRCSEAERMVEETKEMERKALARVTESEAAFVELLGDANARDQAYQDKIAELEKLCAQTPEETARFYADQSAVYELVTDEIDALEHIMEAERVYIKQLNVLSTLRQQTLVERRQILLKHMGDSPSDMTQRVGREKSSDSQVARLRAELENLKVTSQRELKVAECRDREVQEKSRYFEAELTRAKTQVVEIEKTQQKLQETEEALRRREHEILEERRMRDAQREQFLVNQQALLARIEVLEKSARPLSPDAIQASEARNVKLASWMRLKH